MSMLIILGVHSLVSAHLATALSNHNNVVVCERIQEQERPSLTLHLKPNDISIDITLMPTCGLTDIQELPPPGDDPPALLNELTTFVLTHGFGLWLVATNEQINKNNLI